MQITFDMDIPFPDPQYGAVNVKITATFRGSHFPQDENGPEEYPELELAAKLDGVPFDLNKTQYEKATEAAWSQYDEELCK